MKRFLLIIVTLLLAACSALPAPTAARLPERQVWEDADIAHYRFELTLSCFCAFRDQMPLTIEVQDGEVVSMTFPDGQPVPMDDPNYEFYLSYGTMEGIFERIEGALADPEAGQVTVKYDPTLGFPLDAAIDYIELAADDEMYLTVSGFEQLP